MLMKYATRYITAYNSIVVNSGLPNPTEFHEYYITVYNRKMVNPGLPNSPEFYEHYNQVRRNANL
jgi:hypothetical protein